MSEPTTILNPEDKPKGERRKTAYQTLLAAIIFGDLAPGSVVDEKAVAKRFGLGLAAVRDALYRLSLEGLIERQPRIGTRIPELGIRQLQEVFELRIMLEGSTAALAAERATPSDIAAMRAALHGFEDVIKEGDFRRLVRMDQQFHHVLAMATYNSLLTRQVTQIHNNASRFWYFGLPRLDPESVGADIGMHLDVVSAIERRDAAEASVVMRTLLGHFPNNVRELFSSPFFLQMEGVYERSNTIRGDPGRGE